MDELQKLRQELNEITAREARYRLESVEDYLALHEKLRQLSATIGERGTYIHQLHLAALAQKAELETATADLEAFVWMLQEAEKAREQAERRTLSGWLRAAFRPRRGAAGTRTPPGDFVYHLTTSPFRLYRTPTFTLHGWGFPRDGRSVTAIRARVAGQEFTGRTGLPSPKAVYAHALPPKHPPSGFQITFDTPPGRHRLALELQIEGIEWLSMLEVPIWCRQESGTD